jgi:hypothetical protein
MFATVLPRFLGQRVILVADRGLPSFENIGEFTEFADQGGRKLEFILAVPDRCYSAPAETVQGLTFSEDSQAEATCPGHRLIVAHDPDRAALQSAKQRAPIAELDLMAGKLVIRLNAQNANEPARALSFRPRGLRLRDLRPRGLQSLCSGSRRGQTDPLHHSQLHRRSVLLGARCRCHCCGKTLRRQTCSLVQWSCPGIWVMA